ncbi:MAG: hypothetical protein ACRCXZ_08435 [Patescibacteria group bacterium]
MTNLEKYTYENFYSKKISNLTVGEALELHYSLNSQFTRWNEYQSDLLKITMKSHDIMDVVFACDTTLKGEMKVELLTFFCKDISYKEYLELVSNSEINQEPFEILKRIGYFKVFWVLISHLWYIPYSYYVGIKMKKKWPILSFKNKMHSKIGDLREEYGIILF